MPSHLETTLQNQITTAGGDMSKTVGELLIDTLKLAGVKRIYGVAGDSLNAITDVIRRTPGIEWSHVRN